MRPVVRTSTLSRIRWALRNQERSSSTFYSNSRKLLIGVNQNHQNLLNTNTHDSALYSRLSLSRGLSAEAVEAADAAKLTVSGFVSSYQSNSINLKRTLSFVPINDFVK